MADDVFGIVGTTQAGAFRVEEVVAEGGFAVVYRAHHNAFRSSVALKCLKVPGRLSQQEQAAFLEQFREEAELLFRLSATLPNIVRPLHVGTLTQPDGRFAPFIAIEWLEGQTLDRIISSRAAAGQPPLGLARTLELLRPVAQTLAQAHAFPGPGGRLSIVHRDLKPENIFIATVHGQEVPKILDFGIAKVKSTATQIAGHQSSQASALSAFTPAYGAPEQWLPKRFGQTGTWTDVWGLAITAVECLCGAPPIDGEVAAMMGSAIDPLRRPTPRNEGVAVSDAVEAVFEKALAVDPKDRYHDVLLFFTDLTRAAAGEAGLGAPSAKRTAVGAPPMSLAPPTAPGVTWQHGPQRTVPAASSGAPDLVPDLVIDAPPVARSQRPVQGSRRPPAVTVPSQGPATSQRPATSGVPNHLLGRMVDSFDDDPGVAPAGVRRRSLELEDASMDVPRGRAPSPRVVAAAAAIRHGEVPKLELKGPLQLLALAVAIMIADFVYARVVGEAFRLGPARAIWVAGPLAGLGIALVVTRLIKSAE